MAPNTKHCDRCTQERSPFVISDDRSPKMKERSPFTPNTKHYDRCTECDRLS
ncbi:hypothetical protein [Microcoleus sp. EPA2]|uniref:hypothetical protein n=1 Tax=Microcoleus sp. EPA2 TaxID=2841654 RepID=UPI00312B8DDA